MSRQHGKYPCYAFPLMLAGDLDFYNYFIEYGSELDQISGDDCFVMIVADEVREQLSIKNNLGTNWAILTGSDNGRQINRKLGERFDLVYTDFPAMVFFRNIHDSKYLLIRFKGLTTSEVVNLMREVFSVVVGAVRANKDILSELEKFKMRESLKFKGMVISEGIKELYQISIKAAIEGLFEIMKRPL